MGLADMGMPNMGIDYDQLIRASRPEIPGQNLRVTLSGLAGQLYGGQEQKQHSLIDQASALAQLDAKMRGEASDEWMQGAPGRVADIQRGNVMSQDALSDVGTSVDTARQERKNKYSETEIKQQQDDMSKLAPYLNASEKATPDQMAILKQQIKDSGLKWGKNRFSVGDMPDGTFENFMKAMRQAQVNDPKYKQLELNAWSRVASAEERSKGIMGAADIRGQYALKLKQMGIDNPAKMASEWDRINARIGQVGFDGLSDTEKDEYHSLATVRLAGQLTRVATAKPNVSVDEKGNITRTPATSPTEFGDILGSGGGGSSSPAPNPKEPKIGDTWDLGGGKSAKIANIARRDGKITKIQLDNGQVIPYK